MLHPSYYFNLSELKNTQYISSLFEEDVLIWDVIKKIPIHLKKQSLGKIDISIPSGVFIENPELISIGSGTIVEPGAYIKGPALIGKGCKIRHGAYIRENVILGDESVIGHSTEIKNSLLLPGAHAAHFNYVGDSILGINTNLGAGVICANLRLDKKKITIKIDGKKTETGLEKMGLILGDRSQIGCNSVTSPGTLIGQDVFCHPCINISGFILSSTNVKT